MQQPWETNIKNTNLQDSVAYRILLIDFLGWYYSDAIVGALKIWGNYLAANMRYFSVSDLLKSLLSPWHRDEADYGRGFDLNRYMKIWSMNMVSRGVGFVVRISVVTFALAMEIMILCFGLIFLAFWILAPVTMTLAFLIGAGMVLGF